MGTNRCLFSLLFSNNDIVIAASVATAERTLQSKPHEGDDEIYTTTKNGFAFAAFCYFVAFFLALSAAIIVSPACTGSRKEYAILKRPGSNSTAPV